MKDGCAQKAGKGNGNHRPYHLPELVQHLHRIGGIQKITEIEGHCQELNAE